MAVYSYPSDDAIYDALIAGEHGDYTDEQVREWADAVESALYDRGWIIFDNHNTRYVYDSERIEEEYGDGDAFSDQVFWPTVAEFDNPDKW